MNRSSAEMILAKARAHLRETAESADIFSVVAALAESESGTAAIETNCCEQRFDCFVQLLNQ